MRFFTWCCAGLTLSLFGASAAAATGASIQFLEGSPVALSGSGRQVLLAGVRADPHATSLRIGNAVAGLWDLDDRSYELIDGSAFSFGATWTDLSTDGTTVVGHTGIRTPDSEIAGPFRWRRGSGFEQLGEISEAANPPSLYSSAYGLSGDGDVVIGSTRPALLLDPHWERALWNENGDLVDLPAEPSGTTSLFEQISDDGLTFAGTRREVLGDRVRSAAIRWSEEAGSIELVPASFQAATSTTTALSGDGLVAFGTYHRNSPEFGRVFVEDAESGFLDLGQLLPNALSGSLLAANRDGSIAVGEVAYFGRLEGTFNSPGEAVVWERDSGVRTLAEILEALGVDLRGATLRSALDVSSDGTHILGRTSDGYAFVATIPEPTTALLMGLGLVGLAAGSGKPRGRRRSSGSH